MKKTIIFGLCAALTVSSVVLPTTAGAAKHTETVSYTYNAGNWNTYTREMEKLDRGLVAVKTGNSVFLSWRLFDSEDNHFGSAASNVTFNIYRDGQMIANVSNKTNYTDTTAGTSYSVAPVVNGAEGEKCAAVGVNQNSYFDIPLVKPADETIEFVYPYTNQDYDITLTNATYSFFPADCSTGDLDGDGQYEIVVKWTSSERDVGSPGDPAYSGTVHLAAYKLNGTKMWDKDIELGKNVYSSAHTVQFLVYDFDLDGKAEVMCQTSLGSKDATGAYVTNCAHEGSQVATTKKEISTYTAEENESADYRGYGRIVTGEEFLTVFNGETGAAMDTIDLPTSRGSWNGVDYGDDFGNRSNRFIADVAYLDGVKPYAVYLRGYYFGRNGRQRTSIAGISFDGTTLSPDYRFDTQEGQPGYYEGAYKYVGNGNHNCTVADTDNDGKDEFITGALCMEVKGDNSFKPKWCTFMEHGDALHIGDYDPTHEGFEFFTVHEDGGPNTMSGTSVEINYGMSVIDPGVDAETPSAEGYNDLILLHKTASGDTGRGTMANVGSGGYYQISSGAGTMACYGGKDFRDTPNGGGSNFRVFWNGDLYDDILDGTNVTTWNGSKYENILSAGRMGCTKINGTKSNPALQADLFGDWREELVYPTTDGNNLRVFTTTTPTEYKIKTLMHDPVYRSGVAAEQTAYNQPPHVGMYLDDDQFAMELKSISVDASGAKTKYNKGDSLDITNLVVTANYTDDSSRQITNYTVSELDSSTYGTKTITVTYKDKTATYDVVVKEPDITDIENTYTTDSTTTSAVDIPIGSFSGSFTIEHDVTVNSMPADGNSSKYSTSGFFTRFMNLEDNVTGGGWYTTANGSNKVNIYWKQGASNNNATDVATDDKALTLGQTYTFKYDFTGVGTGDGARLTLSIYDGNGDLVAIQSNLNLRNFTDVDSGKQAPISVIEVCNQAKENAVSSVIFSNAKVYGRGNIAAVSGKNIYVNLSSLTGVNLYAAKYNADGTLNTVEALKAEAVGESVIAASFEPDKVFLWNGMMPLDMWEKTGN